MIGMRYTMLYLALALVTAQLSWAPIARGAETKGQPAWFTKAMAREKKVRRTSKLKFPDAELTGRIPGKIISKPEKSDGSWYFSANIGTEAPLECAFYEEPLSLAYATSAVADGILEAMVESIGPMQTKALLAADVGHNEGSPVLALEWIYTVGEKNAARAGLAKLRSTTIGEDVLICWHNELGYRATFERAFKSLASSAKSTPRQTPYYEALYLQSLGDKPIGFVQMILTMDEEGDTRIEVVDASLLPVDNKTLKTSDSISVSYSTPEGLLINALQSSEENGELTVNLNLDPAEGKGWQVSGEYQGKKLDATIETDEPLLSELGQTFAIVQLQNNPEKNETTASAWEPEIDPTRLLPIEISLDAKDRLAGQMTVGGIDMKVTLDRSGNMVEGVGEVGTIAISVTRVWERGQVPAPKK